MWPFSKKPVQPVTVQVIQRDRSKVRLREVRADRNLTNNIAKSMGSGIQELVMDVMHNEHPANAVLPFDAPMEIRAYHQARCEGYTIALANLEAMAVFEQPHKPLEPTFQDENKTETLQ